MNGSDFQGRVSEFLLQFNLSNEVYRLPVEDCLDLFGENYNQFMEKEGLSNNVTCLIHAPVLGSTELLKGCILSIIAVFSLIGNLATIRSIINSKRRRAGHIYNMLYHLSIADLSVTLWCIFGDAIWYLTVEWKLGNVECKIFKYAQMFSLYLSTFIMVLIGVDRFIAIKYPMKSMSMEKCYRLIILCWALSATLSTPQLLVFNVMTGPFQEPFHQCVTYGSYSSDWQEQLYTMFTVAFTFVIPLTIIATTYLLTVCTLHRNQDVMAHSRAFQSIADPNRRKLIRRAKMKSLRISFAIVAAFIICWTPYYMSMIYFFINRKDGQEPEDPDNILFTMCFFFGMSNSLCNPIIYGCFHLRKPRGRKEILRGDSKKKNRRTFLTQLSFHPASTTDSTRESGLVLNANENRNCQTKVASEVTYTNGKTIISETVSQLFVSSTLEENTEV